MGHRKLSYAVGKAGAKFAPGAVNPPKIPERPSAEGFSRPARARAPERPSAEGFYCPAAAATYQPRLFRYWRLRVMASMGVRPMDWSCSTTTHWAPASTEASRMGGKS